MFKSHLKNETWKLREFYGFEKGIYGRLYEYTYLRFKIEKY